MVYTIARTRRLGTFVAALIISLVPLGARAQDVPSYAAPSYASADETIHGRIRSVDGAFAISVDDDRGFVDAVELHGGTIINPTGLTLSPGMSVTILGVNAGSTFDANEIDTPYTYDGPLPTPVYYGTGYWCPGFAYGYGPSFSLAIVFGGGRGWSYEHRPFYGRPWNGSGYFGAAVGVPFDRQHVGASFDPARVREPYEPRRVTGPAAHVSPAFAGRSFAGENRNGYREAVGSQRFYGAGSEREASNAGAERRATGYNAQSSARTAYRGGGEPRQAGGGGASHAAPAAHSGGSGGGGHAGRGH